MSIWIKICGNTSLADARLAVEAGYQARRAGRIPRRWLAQASSPTEGTLSLDPPDPLDLPDPLELPN